MASKLLNKSSYLKWCLPAKDIIYNVPLLFIANKHTVKRLLNSIKISKSHLSVVTIPQKFYEIKNRYSINRLYSDFKYKYAPDVEKAINRQIQAEQQAAQDYLAFAVVFLHPRQSRPGAGGYFMRMFEEEMGHMQDLVRYQLTRGGMPLINGLSAPKVKADVTMLEAFQKGLAMEKSVTELLEAVVKAAQAAKDEQCADFIISKFLSEQMVSINEMSHHVSKLSRLCDEHSLYHYDLWLSKKYPWSYKKTPDS